jgi:hypothetical protein
VEFLSTSSFEILNQGNEPTFYNGYRSEVINITLGSIGLLENIRGLGGFTQTLPIRPQAYSVHSTGLTASAPGKESQGNRLGLLSGGTAGGAGSGPDGVHSR